MDNRQFEVLSKRLDVIEEKENNNTMMLVELMKLTRVLADKAVFTGDAAEEFETIKNKVSAIADEIGA